MRDCNRGDVAGAVGARLRELHGTLKADYPAVNRMAVALYDPRSDLLRTFVHSTDGDSPLQHYQARLRDVPSLAMLASERTDRVIHDLEALGPRGGQHTRCLLERGYRSSYTMPFYEGDQLCGFVFYDSLQEGMFTPTTVRYLSVFSNLTSLLVLKCLAPIPLLLSAVRVAGQVTRLRDADTANHLERMGRYTRIIAGPVAEGHGMSDEYVEFLGRLAPLHDIGKMGIPDEILYKPGPLTPDELGQMRDHVSKGASMIEAVAREFALGELPHTEMLLNLVRCHHEAVDGSGYPRGLRGEEIPLEARVVAVADVFDALTTARPYKTPWSNEDACAFLRQRAGTVFDAGCVAALEDRLDEIAEVQLAFAEVGAAGSHEGYDIAL